MKIPQGDPAPVGRFGEGKQPGFQQTPSLFEYTPFLRVFWASCRQSHGRDVPEERLKGSPLLEKLVQGQTRKMLQEADEKHLLLQVLGDLFREGDAVQEKLQEGEGERRGGFSAGHEVADQRLVIRLFVGNRGSAGGRVQPPGGPCGQFRRAAGAYPCPEGWGMLRFGIFCPGPQARTLENRLESYVFPFVITMTRGLD